MTEDGERAGDLDLLTMQAALQLDGRGRVTRSSGVLAVVAREGTRSWTGADVPDALAGRLGEIFADNAEATRPEEPPRALDLCRRAISDELGVRTVLRGLPSYVFDATARFDSGARIERSDRPRRSGLRDANPGNWTATEWEDLLAGRLGPWAIAADDGRVLSICHTPLPLSDRAAECGVWTRPEERGRGHAAATAAEWADMLRPSGRRLFYSHDADNVSSRRVAERLALRPIGWIWRVDREDDDGRRQVHPLSRERDGRAHTAAG